MLSKPNTHIDKFTIGFICDLLFYNNLIDTATYDKICDATTHQEFYGVIDWLADREMHDATGGRKML